MASVNVKFVVSFSSQDKIHKVSNLLMNNSSNKPWLSDPQDRSGQIDAIFQLDRPCQLAYIDIGVIWCASMEVRVGKSDWPQGHSYVTLVPTQVLMSPVDSRLSRNVSRTCMFSKDHFTKEGASDLSSWDRIQVIGRQPWRKDVQLGLSFIRIRCSDSSDPDPDSSKLSSDSGSRTGKTLGVAAMEQHFFGNKKDEKREDSELKNRLQKIAATAEGVIANPDILSRSAHMVLLANKSCLKPESADQDSCNHSPASVNSSAAEQQEQTIRPEEVTSFLGTLSIGKEDIKSLKVSDLRHKFEKRKWRKLTSDEKRTFYNCCQDFIGRMFDDEADAASTTSPTVNFTAVSEYSPHHQNSRKMAVEKASVFRTSSGSSCRVLTGGRNNHGSVNASPKSSSSKALADIKVSGDGKSPRSDQRLCGGFLTSVFSITDPMRDKNSVTPNKSTRNVSKAQNGHEAVDGASSGQITHCQTPPYGQTNSIQKTVSSSAKHKFTNGQNGAIIHTGKLRTGDPDFHSEEFCTRKKDVMMLPDSVRNCDKPSSPQLNTSVRTSNINKSLLNTHRRFVKGRLENISSSRSSESSSAAAASCINQEPKSEQPSTPAQSSTVSSEQRHRSSRKGSQIPAKKRPGTPLNVSDFLNPARQRPKFCSTPKGVDSSPQVQEDGPWLNAKRDGCRSNSSGSGRASRQTTAAWSTEDLDSPPSSKTTAGSRDRGTKRGRGQGRGVAKRRLEMPGSSASPTSPMPTSPAAFAGSGSPFLDERQIDEDTVFVQCPLCDDMFPADTVSTHAADCQGRQFSGGAQGTQFVKCPLCEDMFSEDVIEEHASHCCL